MSYARLLEDGEVQCIHCGRLTQFKAKERLPLSCPACGAGGPWMAGQSKEPSNGPSRGIDLAALETNARRVLGLLEDKHPGLATWNEALGNAINDLGATLEGE